MFLLCTTTFHAVVVVGFAFLYFIICYDTYLLMQYKLVVSFLLGCCRYTVMHQSALSNWVVICVGSIIACYIVWISAGDHGPFSDQPFTIKFFIFCPNGRFKGLRLESGLE